MQGIKQMPSKILSYEIIVSAVKLTEGRLPVVLMKCIFLARYRLLTTFVFLLVSTSMFSIWTQFRFPPSKMGWPKYHQWFMAWFNWWLVQLVTNWLASLEFFLIFCFFSIISLPKSNILGECVQCGRCRFLSN